MNTRRWMTGLLLVAVCWVPISGCSNSNSGGKRTFVTLGTAPAGGAFYPVGNAIAAVLDENKGDNNWKVQSKGTKGSQQNIRMLDNGEIQLAMSNSAISYYAYNGGGVWDKKYDVRAVVTLAPNVGTFICKAGSGINSLADLKGKRITVGPGGAGFEMFLGPLLTGHGVTYTDKEQAFTPINAIYTDAVALLADGKTDAAFVGGAVPLPAATQACSTMDIVFIPYDDTVKQQLVDDYPFYQPITVTKDKYTDLNEDFPALNVGSMHLITSADVDEETIYQLTKTIWEHREAIAKQHPAGKAINEKNAARFTGTPFHAGAIKFYKEIGIWSEPEGDASQGTTNED